jgi:ABC-2 type transport system ATP-binding protein
VIKVTGLTRKYGRFIAVNNVSFNIKKGEIIGLLGHNGAGKTTVMKMLTGYLQPDAGTIEIDGFDIATHRSQSQRKIGYLPENCPVYPEMTIIDYLDFAAELSGLTAQTKIAAIRAVITSTELTLKATHRINTLSRGYKQRVGVAQALLHKPEILILDEPTNGLDPTQILQLRELIKQLSQTTTVIISTHILQEVQAVCERVLILRDGLLITDARLVELQHSEVVNLTCDCAPEVLQAQLAGQCGVNSIKHEQLGEHLYQYELALENQQQSAQELIPEMVRRLSQQDISIFAIYPQQHDLESVFRQVNAIDHQITGEQADAA